MRTRERMMNYNHSSKFIAVTLLVLVLILVQHVHASVSRLQCREEERAALLKIKAQISFPSYSTAGEWKGKECCQWERVTCDPTTGHVTKLDLGIPLGAHGYTTSSLVNATIFLPLRQLRSLSLFGQFISGFITGAGLEIWHNLTMLEILDLSYNNLNGSIINSLAGVSSLHTLKLVCNFIGDGLPINGLEVWHNLTMLEILDLSYNFMNGSIINSLAGVSSLHTLKLVDNFIGNSFPINGFESWTNLTKLETLDLTSTQLCSSAISSLVKVSSLRALYLDNNFIISYEDLNKPPLTYTIKEFDALNLEVLSLPDCGFFGSFPNLGHWSSLKALSLAGNSLNGTLTSEGLCRLKNLEELDLSGNGLTGNLPLCIGNLSSLRLIDFSNNGFQVKFPSSIYERLISLRYLSLSQNQLEGTFSIKSFRNHSNLEVLKLSSQTLNIQAKAVNVPFQLLDLELTDCIIDAEPNFLLSQYKLQLLDLSNTRSKGPAPVSWLLENNTDMYSLDLHKNFFTGYLQLPFLTHQKLFKLDISDNVLDGELPVHITSKLPNLAFLNLSQNYFHGNLPLISSRLKIVDLSINNLTDDIDSSFSKILPSFPYYMDLSNNLLYGHFPKNMNSTVFSVLLLYNNHISGEIPFSICSTRLLMLDVGRNELSGVLPDCIGRAELSTLKLSENHLEGYLPEICGGGVLRFLDLSDNMFTGSIPPCNNQSVIEMVDLSQNNLSGNFPITWLNVSGITEMNIRENHLYGELPKFWMGRESKLAMLQAANNQFEGYIQEDMCQFKYLRILDLSQNNIYGQVPSCIYEMGVRENNFKYLWMLVLSQNNIYGQQVLSDYVEEELIPGTGFSNYGLNIYLDDSGANMLKSETNFSLNIRFGVRRGVFKKSDYGLEFMSKEKLYFYTEGILTLEGVLDLSSNKLAGYIPEKIGQMTWLTTLNLSNNHFSGAIPTSISNLSQLESLDLSHNSLTGQIPRDLTKLTSLEYFSVAYNNLSGPTLGVEAQFDSFGYSSYEGNPNLCGFPLPKNCSLILNTTNGRNDGGRYENTDYLILFGSSCLVFVASFWGFMAILYFKRNWRYALFNWVDRYGDVIYVRVVLFTRKIGAWTLRGR